MTGGGGTNTKPTNNQLTCDNNKLLWIGSGVLGLAIGMEFMQSKLASLLFILGLTMSAVFGVLTYLFLRIYFSSEYQFRCQLPNSVRKMQNLVCQLALAKEEEVKAIKDEAKASVPPKISRNIDQMLNEIVDLVIRDYIFYWINDLMSAHDEPKRVLKSDFWVIIMNIKQRLGKVDHVKLLANDVVKKMTDHLEKIRIVQSLHHDSPNHGQKNPQFAISAHLMSAEQELEYLSKVAEALVILVFPSDYSRPIHIRHLLRDILARHVFAPAIDKITSPAYINSKLISYIKKNQSVRELSQKTFIYADSYEDFLKMISSTNDVSEISHIRYNILTEIMQATTLENLRKAKGNQSQASEASKKTNLTSPRHMQRYISQLVHAKGICERRLAELGSDSFAQEGDYGSRQANKSVSFGTVMGSAFTRKYFYLYLEEEHHHELLGFWSAVEELKTSKRQLWHQLATEVFYCYINKSSIEMLKPNRSSLKRIENFLIGEGDPTVFFELQQHVESVLRDNFFPAFLLSDQCAKMMRDAELNQVNLINNSPKEISPLDDPEQPGGRVVGGSSLSKTQLDVINEKLQNKTQALMALKSSVKPESKILQIIEGEIEELKNQRKDFDIHLSRTDTWANHLGLWKCQIQTLEATDNEKDGPFKATILSYLPSSSDSAGLESSTSWFCVRNVSEFHQLHKELQSYGMKSVELPAMSKSLFPRNTKNILDKSKQLLQNFLDGIMEDDQLNGSEVVYSFLSPNNNSAFTNNNGAKVSPNSKRGVTSPFFNFLRTDSQTPRKDADNSDETRFLLDLDLDTVISEDQVDAKAQVGRPGDAIAEALYALIGEVFDMRGVFKWLRKSLMTFVQITYGSSINRQIRNSVDWIISEQMILYYLATFKKAHWHNNKLKTGATTSDKMSDDKLGHLTAETRELLTPENIPEVLINLVGQQAAVNGIRKVFETLQNGTLNKQLFYEILELFMYETFPELRSNVGSAAFSIKNSNFGS